MAFHLWNEMTTMATSHLRTANVSPLVVAVYCSFLEFQCCNQGSWECDMSHSLFFTQLSWIFDTASRAARAKAKVCQCITCCRPLTSSNTWGNSVGCVAWRAVRGSAFSPARCWMSAWDLLHKDPESDANESTLQVPRRQIISFFFLRLHVGINQLSQLLPPEDSTPVGEETRHHIRFQTIVWIN